MDQSHHLCLAQFAAASLKACSNMSTQTHTQTQTHSHTKQKTRNKFSIDLFFVFLGSVFVFPSNGWFGSKPEKGSVCVGGAACLQHKACKRLPLRMVEGSSVGR